MTAQQMATPAEQLHPVTIPIPQPNESPLRDWVHQIARAWDHLAVGRRIQIARFAGMDYQLAYEVSSCQFRNLEETERAKLIGTISHLAVWVWENFEQGGVQ